MDSLYPEGYLLGTAENEERIKSIAALNLTADRGDIVEATALLCDAEHNLIVNLNGIRGIVPREEGAIGISTGEVRDIALISRVGKPICFTVERITEDSSGKPLAILSRKRAQLRCKRLKLDKLVPGDIIPARITHFEPFGAFLDVGCGCAALLPIDSISVSRISHPRDRFGCGDDIKVIVKSNENGRITLTHKELLGTWEENAALFSQGQTVSGIIRSIEEYGVFVELTPNLAGLAEPKEGVFPGQRASVYIKNLLPEKMKVKLIIIDAFDQGEAKPRPPKLFFDGEHINKWVYSPEGCGKYIFTDFTIENGEDKIYNVD